MILKCELNARNKITAIGALAVRELRYSFGTINWGTEEIRNIDRKTRNMLTMYKTRKMLPMYKTRKMLTVYKTIKMLPMYKTRKMLTVYKMHHPKGDTDRLYVKGKEGGRELVQIEASYKAEIINTAEYLNTNYKEDQFVNIVKSHESNQPSMNSTNKTRVQKN